MSKRKPLDKAQARQLRDQMLASAAAARLSLTDGVRDMRSISGMTQEDFARHRGVSARVIKAIELGQGNPTIATLNRIGAFFGLEVAFVPVKRVSSAESEAKVAPVSENSSEKWLGLTFADHVRLTKEIQEMFDAQARMFSGILERVEGQQKSIKSDKTKKRNTGS